MLCQRKDEFWVLIPALPHIRRSQHKAISRPPPNAAPSITAIVGI